MKRLTLKLLIVAGGVLLIIAAILSVLDARRDRRIQKLQSESPEYRALMER